VEVLERTVTNAHRDERPHTNRDVLWFVPLGHLKEWGEERPELRAAPPRHQCEQAHPDVGDRVLVLRARDRAKLEPRLEDAVEIVFD